MHGAPRPQPRLETAYCNEEGGTSTTEIVTAVVVEPPEFSAVTVYDWATPRLVPVPVITAVVVPIDSPEGSAGDTEKDRIGPPLVPGGPSVQGTPMVQTKALDKYVRPVGGCSVTSSGRVVDAEPAALVT